MPAYSKPNDEYFEKRTLRRHARVLHLWALGVAAVISGDFFGWNFGLTAGGFSGMLTALVIMTAMYAGLCFSIAEMSPALPHTGGAYSFARTAMGPWGGYITGLAENMEYILTPATIVVGIGGYLGAIFHTPKSWEPGWWVVCYVDLRGAECFRRSPLIPLLRLHRASGADRIDRLLDRRDSSRRFQTLRIRRSVKRMAARAAFRAMALPRNRAASPSRRGIARPPPRHAERHSLWPLDADRLLFSDHDPERRHRTRRGETRRIAGAARSEFSNHRRFRLDQAFWQRSPASA